MRMSIPEWQRRQKDVCDMFIACSSVQTVDSMSPFSIGLCASMWTVEPQSLLCAPSAAMESRSTLCYVNINTNTDLSRRPHGIYNRKTYQKTLLRNGFATQDRKLSPTAYWQHLRNSKFVVSPEGNGVDCHRTYEALIAGCIPIVERAHERHLRYVYGDVPLLFTTDYSEITSEYLEAQLAIMLARTDWNFARLFISGLSLHDQKLARQRSACWDNWLHHGKNLHAPHMQTWAQGCESYRILRPKDVALYGHIQ